MKRIFKFKSFMPVIFIFLAMLSIVTAEDKKYLKNNDGTAGLEIGISSDNKIMLEEEKIRIDFSLPENNGGMIGDELIAKAHSEYELFNSDSRDAYAAIAQIRLIKVKKIEIKRSEENEFRSGESIIVDDETLNGMIYPIDTPERIMKNSVYDDLAEDMSHMEFGGYFEEAFAKYGITSFTDHEEKLGDSVSRIPKSEYRSLYIEAEDGEEMLCVVVYNLHFEALESKRLEISQSFFGSMKRPTDISELGTEFNFVYSGANLKSFYNVNEISVEFNFPKNEKLALLELDAPYYLNDGIPTIHYAGGFDFISLSLGEYADEEEIYDTLLQGGILRKIFDAVGAITLVGLVVAVAYIIFTINKRRKSGIGMQL